MREELPLYRIDLRTNPVGIVGDERLIRKFYTLYFKGQYDIHNFRYQYTVDVIREVQGNNRESSSMKGEKRVRGKLKRLLPQWKMSLQSALFLRKNFISLFSQTVNGKFYLLIEEELIKPRKEENYLRTNISLQTSFFLIEYLS